MTAPDTVVGFDGSATGDVSLVVMHRGPDGIWQVEKTDGPDVAELAQLADRLFPAPAPLPEPEVSLQEQVLQWLDAYAGGTLDLDDAQKDWLRQVYSGAVRAGRLSHPVGHQLNRHVKRAAAADPDRPAAASN